MPRVFIGVGSNLGDRAGYFEFAKKEILQSGKFTDLRCSPVYETEPVTAEGGLFLNSVWSVETDLSPRELLKKLQAVEAAAGRRRDKPNQARTLDLDILFYGEQVILDPDITVPHPRLHERAFVLIPFCDLACEWGHPVLGKTIKQLLEELNKQNSVKCTAYGEKLSLPTVPCVQTPR